MRFQWRERFVASTDVVTRLQNDLNSLAEPLARLLVLRGIDSLDAARAFFRGTLDDLHDPFSMAGMDAAADRLALAIERAEPVLVFGDYDVDGTTATALMVSFLRQRGLPVTYHVPDRLTEGYGLSNHAVDLAAEAGTRLMIALDCGVTAVDEAAYARAHGIDLIICDHHTPGDEIPDAFAVLDPKRVDCSYPFKDLSGCGVGFKLVQAVLHRLRLDPVLAHGYLDLVAISAAADIVSVTGENRILMREGFRMIEERPRPGLAALAARANLTLAPCNSGRIVFGVGPRINAAGRMRSARSAVELLLAPTLEEAAPIADELERLNDRRRELDERTLAEAVEAAALLMPRNGLVLYRPDWHPGIIGIVASRIVERYYRPTVLLCNVNGRVKGSARSIEGVNIYDALAQCRHLLEGFGGHDYAAGVTLSEASVPAFTEAFDACLAATCDEDMLTPAINVDAPLSLDDVDGRFWAVLKQFAPFGPSNARPVFCATKLDVVGRPRAVGRDAAHLKFAVRSRREGSRPFEVIGFRLGEHLPTIEEATKTRKPLDLLFTIDENDWNGERNLQLQVRDLRPSVEKDAN